MGFLAAIPYKTEGANNKKTIKKLEKELGFESGDLVKRLMQVSMDFFFLTPAITKYYACKMFKPRFQCFFHIQWMILNHKSFKNRNPGIHLDLSAIWHKDTTLIFENLKPEEKSKKIFWHHLKIFKINFWASPS